MKLAIIVSVTALSIATAHAQFWQRIPKEGGEELLVVSKKLEDPTMRVLSILALNRCCLLENSKKDDVPSLRSAVRAYNEAIKKVSVHVADCPEDFQVAFKAHKKAAGGVLELLESAPDNAVDALLELLGRRERGQPLIDSPIESKKTERQVIAQFNESYTDLYSIFKKRAEDYKNVSKADKESLQEISRLYDKWDLDKAKNKERFKPVE